VRLNVSVLRTKKFFYTIDGQPLNRIDMFTATVIATTRVAFGILIGQHCTLRLHYSHGRVIFRGNHFQAVLLPVQSLINESRDLRVELGEILSQRWSNLRSETSHASSLKKS